MSEPRCACFTFDNTGEAWRCRQCGFVTPIISQEIAHNHAPPEPSAPAPTPQAQQETRPDRAPSVVWLLRRHNDEYVTTAVDDGVILWLNDAVDGRRKGTWVSRGTARLLAKRLNQCLDSTVKR